MINRNARCVTNIVFCKAEVTYGHIPEGHDYTSSRIQKRHWCKKVTQALRHENNGDWKDSIPNRGTVSSKRKSPGPG